MSDRELASPEGVSMRISFRSRLLRFTVTTGDDDVSETEYEAEDEQLDDEERPVDYLQLLSGSFDTSPREADYEDATYVPDWEEDRVRPGRKTPHSFGFAPRKSGQ